MNAAPLSARAQRGVTLIEMMVALLIGSLVVLAVTGIALSNQQTFRSTNSLADIQESARSAFDLMARDIRQAGDDGCGNFGIANENSSGQWWQKWEPLTIYSKTAASPDSSFGTGAAERVNNTQAIRYQGVDDAPHALAKPLTSGQKDADIVASDTSVLAAKDYAIICDWERKGSLVKVKSVTTNKIALDDSPANGYVKNGTISRYQAGVWYIGHNGRSDQSSQTSLYRARLDKDGKVSKEEVLPGVTNMTVKTYNKKDIDPALNIDPAENKPSVLEVTLTIEGEEANVAVEGDPASGTVTDKHRIKRDFSIIVPLRNYSIDEIEKTKTTSLFPPTGALA